MPGRASASRRLEPEPSTLSLNSVLSSAEQLDFSFVMPGGIFAEVLNAVQARASPRRDSRLSQHARCMDRWHARAYVMGFALDHVVCICNFF